MKMMMRSGYREGSELRGLVLICDCLDTGMGDPVLGLAAPGTLCSSPSRSAGAIPW